MVELVAIIPAYRAERTIAQVVKLTSKFAPKTIVVDDGSPDETARRARLAGATVIRHPKNLGKAAAILTGISTAKNLSPEYVIFLDSDLQHNPAEIPAVLSPLKGGLADVSIGSRLLSKNEHGRKMPTNRMLGNIISSRTTSVLIGTRLTDVLSGFRAFNRKALSILTFKSSGYDIELSSVLEAAANGLRIAEVPIETIYLEETSHIRPVKLIIGTLGLWGKWILSRKSFRKSRKNSGNS